MTFECSFYFLVFYKKYLEEEEEITLLKQKNKENVDVMFYKEFLQPYSIHEY